MAFFSSIAAVAAQVSASSVPRESAGPISSPDPQQAHTMTTDIQTLIDLNSTAKALQARVGGMTPAFQGAIKEVVAALQTQPFWYVVPTNHPKGHLPWLLDSASGLMWVGVSGDEGFSTAYSLDGANQRLKQFPSIANRAWQVPSGDVLWAFAGREGNPWQAGPNRRLWSQWCWTISSGNYLHLDNNSRPSGGGQLIGVCSAFADELGELVLTSVLEDWLVAIADNNKTLDLDELWGQALARQLQTAFKRLDHRSARLPELDGTTFSDPAKGLWELWGIDPDGLDHFGLRARNPADDVQQGMVAIDFGTSSTVVAYEEHGVGKLLRIGVADFWEKEKPAHYENPTVLEFVDLPGFFDAWNQQAQRPAVSWDDVRCSHEALHNFRNNQSKPDVVASILTKIKRWALDDDSGQQTRTRITDQTEDRVEHVLAPLTLRNPVKGQPLQVSEEDPFDPIELYAWFLGLTINWRQRGIFLRYYMSFPVDYPREVKEKILASFRRGLQRSLPATLVTQPVFQQFTVEERASEPAAYAAIALQTLQIEPTEEGAAYAVFDFGGGTTDFDFGRYRLPTEAEERSGIEQVFEHFGNGGDKFLGGENLLDHMAYLTFRHNLEVCRSKKIAFSRPPDAQAFSGSEMFLENTQAAVTNTLMLVGRLRTFWETGQQGSSGSGVEKIDLIDREGKKVPCEFTIPWPELTAFLQNRIAEGVFNFFTTLKKAFGADLPTTVNILLAGNASRSATVLGLFGLLPEESALYVLKESTTDFLGELFPEGCPEFTAHKPLEADPANVDRPTCKTGVALGLLQLCPGSTTKVVNHAAVQSGGEAPFQHFVGRLRRGKFHAAVHQGAVYNTWVELGPLGEDRVFKLFHTQAALALGGAMQAGDAALKQKTLEFAGKSPHQQVLARPIKPHEIEVCNAVSVDAAQSGDIENLQVLRLG